MRVVIHAAVQRERRRQDRVESDVVKAHPVAATVCVVIDAPETDDIVNRKVKAAFEAGLKPILCVGESLKENESGMAEKVITRQIQSALAGVNPASQIVVAYEPIWAIGTGRAATGKQANATISLIRATVDKLWDNETAQAIRILYGGSVTASNIAEFIAEPEIDGALVGGASLKANEFLSIVSQAATIKSPR